MKNVIWLVLAAIAVAAAYFVFVKPQMDNDITPVVTSPVVETPVDAPETGAEIAEPAPVEDAVEEMQDTAQGAAEIAQDAVEDAAESAQDAVETAVEDASEAAEQVVEDAADAAEQAVKDAVQSATEAAGAAAEAADGAMEASPEATEETAAEAPELSDPADLFTVDGFALDKALEYVEASDLDAATKMATKTAIEQAKDNPELLKVALQAARAKLGL